MATKGFFTYYDLYGGDPKIHRYESNNKLSSYRKMKLLSLLNAPNASSLTATVTSSSIAKNSELVTSTAIQTNNEFLKLVQLVPFAYLHWFLIGLAILLALILFIIFICYCRRCCRKNNKYQK